MKICNNQYKINTIKLKKDMLSFTKKYILNGFYILLFYFAVISGLIFMSGPSTTMNVEYSLFEVLSFNQMLVMEYLSYEAEAYKVLLSSIQLFGYDIWIMNIGFVLFCILFLIFVAWVVYLAIKSVKDSFCKAYVIKSI